MTSATPFVLATALAVLVPTWVLAKRAFRAWAMHKFTAVPDLVRAGTARAGARVPGTALICGGRCALAPRPPASAD